MTDTEVRPAASEPRATTTDRATVFELLQLGLETTPGTAPTPATSLILPNMQLDQTIDATVEIYTPSGYVFPTSTAEGQEFTSATLKGIASYDEMPFAFCSAFTQVAPTVATGVSTWTIEPAVNAPDSPATYTFQSGSFAHAGQFSFGVFTAFGIDFTRRSCATTGKVSGQLYKDGVTMAPGATMVANSPVVPNQVDVYMDPTFAALGTTKLLRCVQAKYDIDNRYGLIWVLDTAETSFAGIVQTLPTVTLDLTVEADAQGMSLLQNIRTGATAYIRIAGTGFNIPGSTPLTPYSFEIDGAYKVTKASAFEDRDGLYAITWTMRAAADSVAAYAQKVKVVCATASL